MLVYWNTRRTCLEINIRIHGICLFQTIPHQQSARSLSLVVFVADKSSQVPTLSPCHMSLSLLLQVREIESSQLFIISVVRI